VTDAPVLLVLGDSLAHHGPERAHPRIWPVLAAEQLGWRLELVARIGWTSRDAWWALAQDPRVWSALPRAGAVVLAVGGMDSVPSPLPTALREGLRYVRPPALRRVVRRAYLAAQPRLAPLGRPVALPTKLSVDYLEQCRAALQGLRPELLVIGTLPSVHQSPAYASAHKGRPAAERAPRKWSQERDVPMVDLAAAVRPYMGAGQANPDGMHWGWAGHQAVADAVVAAIAQSCPGVTHAG